MSKKAQEASLKAGLAWIRYWDTKRPSDLRRAQSLEESADAVRRADIKGMHSEFQRKPRIRPIKPGNL